MALAKTRRKTITLAAPASSVAVELGILTALNQMVAAIVREFFSFDLPIVAAQEARPFARARVGDENGANARSVIEAIRQRALGIEAQADQKVRRELAREAERHTGKWKAIVGSAAQIDVSLLIRDDDLVDLISVRSEQASNLIRNLSRDVIDRIERETLTAIFEGAGQEDIAKRIRAVAGLGRNRSRLIARDQASKLNAAMNEYRQQQAGVTHYKWKTILDGRERDTHRRNNGKIFAWAKPPPVTKHPGHDINCFPGSTRVTLADGHNKLWRRFYHGPLVTIETGQGVLLEATPNHPILTRRGWLPINALQEGDYVVKAIKRAVVGQDDGNELVTSFSEMFEAALLVKGSQSAALAPSDFHGDGAEGYVDVVVIDGSLLGRIETGGTQGVENIALSWADVYQPLSGFDCLGTLDARSDEMFTGKASDLGMSSRGESATFVGRHLGKPDEICSGSAASRDVVLVQHAINHDAGDAVLVRESLGAHARMVPGNDIYLGKTVVPVWAPLASVHQGVELGTPDADRLAQIVAAAAEDHGGFSEGGPVRYEFDRVVKKGVCEFSGHVFNLETSKGWYAANHIIAHNCRCRALAVLIEDPEDAAELIEEAPIDDPAGTESLSLIEKVALTTQEQPFRWKRDDILVRAAETQQAREIIKALRADKSFTERDVEDLFETVFGFSSEGQNLDRMSGQRFGGLFQTRRSILMHIIASRIDTITETLEHAAETAPL